MYWKTQLRAVLPCFYPVLPVAYDPAALPLAAVAAYFPGRCGDHERR